MQRNPQSVKVTASWAIVLGLAAATAVFAIHRTMMRATLEDAEPAGLEEERDRRTERRAEMPSEMRAHLRDDVLIAAARARRSASPVSDDGSAASVSGDGSASISGDGSAASLSGDGSASSISGPSFSGEGSAVRAPGFASARGEGAALKQASETFRNTSLLMAVRQAGYVCLEMIGVEAGAEDMAAWRVSCDRAMVYFVADDGSGELTVEPVAFGEALPFALGPFEQSPLEQRVPQQ